MRHVLKDYFSLVRSDEKEESVLQIVPDAVKEIPIGSTTLQVDRINLIIILNLYFRDNPFLEKPVKISDQRRGRGLRSQSHIHSILIQISMTHVAHILRAQAVDRFLAIVRLFFVARRAYPHIPTYDYQHIGKSHRHCSIA